MWQTKYFAQAWTVRPGSFRLDVRRLDHPRPFGDVVGK
jgi:hypothetical protein